MSPLGSNVIYQHQGAYYDWKQADYYMARIDSGRGGGGCGPVVPHDLCFSL